MYAHKLGIKMAGQVGSGYVDPTRPASIWTRPDPQNVKIFRTRPDPTRPDPRVDPTREQLCVAVQQKLNQRQKHIGWGVHVDCELHQGRL